MSPRGLQVSGPFLHPGETPAARRTSFTAPRAAGQQETATRGRRDPGQQLRGAERRSVSAGLAAGAAWVTGGRGAGGPARSPALPEALGRSPPGLPGLSHGRGRRPSRGWLWEERPGEPAPPPPAAMLRWAPPRPWRPPSAPARGAASWLCRALGFTGDVSIGPTLTTPCWCGN